MKVSRVHARKKKRKYCLKRIFCMNKRNKLLWFFYYIGFRSFGFRAFIFFIIIFFCVNLALNSWAKPFRASTLCRKKKQKLNKLSVVWSWPLTYGPLCTDGNDTRFWSFAAYSRAVHISRGLKYWRKLSIRWWEVKMIILNIGKC